MIIWLASYPKSGNTWIRSFLSAYYFTDCGKFDFNLLEQFKQFPSKDFINDNIKDPGLISNYWVPIQEKILSNKKITFLKTHNAYINLNNTNFTSEKYTLGVIYILRDPRNLITSLKNHSDISYDEAFNFMANEDTVLYDKRFNDFDTAHFISSWSLHLKSWYNEKKIRKIFIKYEDVENNTYGVFKSIVEFVNNLKDDKNSIDEAKMLKAIETTTFSNLQKKEENGEFQENVYSFKRDKKIKFFNLGKKNKWQEILPESVKIKMNKKFEKELKFFKY